ncbi:serine hydrolase [Flavilitoribacter nigricans]|uniref:Serine hydrolase n=1 Tax=Flavilitoribacter nigricans (strain ATCC 23147 / DSM 23189 / NBRC 102662 / NCIMB 1420 / SS-2) TaxID=1122177 RepID=A0A2D0NFS8_FLAN2|nr:serine hydrolase [Flavilitoribacter nigricans]PHN07354.1 serine hydrolase [Flavilitoribacter nigricans DSM 23189 = NBRC 102662]
MKNLSTLLLLLVTVGELFGQSAAERMGTYLQLLTDAEQFSGSVLVARGDQVLFSKGFGEAAIEYGVPITPTTKFRIGSITKQFTAMAVMKLVEEGKIDLEAPIVDYLADYPEEIGKKVSIHHLLTHSSGIPSYTGMAEIMKHRGSMEEAPEDFIKNFWDKELEFKPGSEFKYNNSGYYLLGMIIEKVSGVPYDEYLKQNIFDPLGMKNSGFEHYRDVIPNMAEGYAAVGDYPEKAGNIVTDMAGAAGALYSTTEDLLRWHRALLEKKIVSEAAYEKIFTPFLNNYGFGWTIEERSGKTVYSHSGGIDGFRSMGILMPEEKLSVIVLANLESANSTRVAQDMAKMYLGEEVEMPKELEVVEVGPEILEKYAGTYNLFPGFDIEIEPNGDHLLIHPTNQNVSPVFPESETIFFSKIVNAKLEFVVNDEGVVNEVILHQNGSHPGKRIE